MSEATHKIKVAYMGPTKLVGGKPGGRWRVMESPDKDLAPGITVMYSTKLSKRARIGSIYELDRTDDGNVFIASRRFVGVVPDDTRLDWEAEASRHVMEEKAAVLPTKTQEILEPLREHYRNRIGHDAKMAYLARIITYITTR